LSNLIKSGRVVSLEDLKKLELVRRTFVKPQTAPDAASSGEEQGGVDAEIENKRQRIIRDAEATAEKLLAQARADAEKILAEARQEAEQWWQQRRAEDERLVQAASKRGYDEGYEAGMAAGNEAAQAAWESRMREARELVESSYAAKERIIAEAESFVVELSVAIAGKLAGTILADSPEQSVKLFAQALARRKEQGVITLCVSPQQFDFVQAAKDELALSLDPQAELYILPDASIAPGGCMIRSSFGSIDATIDTQLEVIREHLLRIAAQVNEEGNPDGPS